MYQFFNKIKINKLFKKNKKKMKILYQKNNLHLNLFLLNLKSNNLKNSQVNRYQGNL